MFKISFKRWFETNFGKEKPELTWALVILSAFKFQLGNLIQLGCLLAELTHSHTLGKQPVRHGLRNSSYPCNRCCLTAV